MQRELLTLCYSAAGSPWLAAASIPSSCGPCPLPPCPTEQKDLTGQLCGRGKPDICFVFVSARRCAAALLAFCAVREAGRAHLDGSWPLCCSGTAPLVALTVVCMPHPCMQPHQPTCHAASAAGAPGQLHRAGRRCGAGSAGAQHRYACLLLTLTAAAGARHCCLLPQLWKHCYCQPPPACLPACPAETGVTSEVDSTERVGLVVSVLHLPPGSTVQATYAKDGLVQERRDAGGWLWR